MGGTPIPLSGIKPIILSVLISAPKEPLRSGSDNSIDCMYALIGWTPYNNRGLK